MKKTLILTLTLIAINLSAQKINQEDLYATWHLDKYSDAEQYYHLPKKEIGDYLSLNQDMSYTAVSEGEMSNGSWFYNTNGKYLELKSEDKTKEKIYIHFLSNNSMVVTYDSDEYRVWEIHYVSSK
jgi:hypothetical protein